MPIDPFQTLADSPLAPASRCFVITPNDSADLPATVKAIYVGQGGDIVLRAIADGADVTFKAVPQGTTLDVRAGAVRATGTTAALLVGLA